MYPKGFKKYAAISKAAGRKLDLSLARYAARYRFAGQIDGLQLRGFSSGVEEVYTTVLRISLAYSAYESLHKFLSPKTIPVKDEALSTRIKTGLPAKFRLFLLNESNSKLGNELTAFFENSRNANLVPVIKALRHSMFHGQFTPTASGLTTRMALEVLAQLEQVLFREMDKCSELVFRSEIADPPGSPV